METITSALPRLRSPKLFKVQQKAEIAVRQLHATGDKAFAAVVDALFARRKRGEKHDDDLVTIQEELSEKEHRAEPVKQPVEREWPMRPEDMEEDEDDQPPPFTHCSIVPSEDGTLRFKLFSEPDEESWGDDEREPLEFIIPETPRRHEYKMAAISLREAGEQFVASAKGTIDRHGGCLTDTQVHYLSLMYDRCEAEKEIVQRMEITMISAEKAKAAAQVYFEDALRYLQKVHRMVTAPKQNEGSDSDERDESSDSEDIDGADERRLTWSTLDTIEECPED